MREKINRPNIVVLFPDQHRADFLGCYGSDFIETPHIDSLAHTGLRYDRAYSTHPLCVPARTALLTGMNAMRTGVLSNGYFIPPNRAEQGIHTWPELLSGSGYHTAAIGKMHFYPWDDNMGFDYRRICEDKRWPLIQDDYSDYLEAQGYKKEHAQNVPGYREGKGSMVSHLPAESNPDHWTGEEACDYIKSRQNADQPFALMVGFPGPHDPYDPDGESANLYQPSDMPKAIGLSDDSNLPGMYRNFIDSRKKDWCGIDYSSLNVDDIGSIRAYYAALVTGIDKAVGSIIKKLKEIGQYDNTIIVYTSDHGDLLGDHRMMGKSLFYESSIRIPMILRGPGIESGVCSNLVSLNDLTASILEWAGVEQPSVMDSRPLREGHEYLIGSLFSGWMIDDGRFRLSRYKTGEVTFFDRHLDPDELNNIAEDKQFSGDFRRLDSALQCSVFENLPKGHSALKLPGSLYNNQSFGKRNWSRPYPGVKTGPRV
jgi:arylsulfatase